MRYLALAVLALAAVCNSLAGCAGKARPEHAAAAASAAPDPAEVTATVAASPTPAATPAATPTAAPAVVPAATLTATPAVPIVPVARVAPVAAGGGAARVIDRVAAERQRVALTFDAGADTGYAAEILDTLRAQRVRATFGMTGTWAERNPELLRRMVGEGHQLMNHTYDHASFTGVSTRGGAMSSEGRRRQIERTEEIVRTIAGAEMRPYFRPPYGDYDASVNADIAAAGYQYNIMWAVDSLGWNGMPAAGIVQRCVQRAAPGAVYVFHVGAASQDAAALPGIIEGLRAAGYGFATVRELVEG